ncbi:class 1 isoprenoid biosynthesis enzyme [Flavobacterium foetidum]|uniref:class 1 isoprenoid biosynthesis enzyme n=1 Tax=Flavobacterium foetidum TaxID=2026681 RepID=UPI00107542C2|nr:class 1 isoprenoid biosynthesis enzyme [Flavobacterium foetidum]KAF2514904.1 class 1 isoprenoid biosynthesis enzyme [Flavobacterium foetidum]
MKFHTYIQRLNIPNNVKNSILDEDFIKKNPIYYQHYPSLFATAFSISEKELNLLDIAGFLYYQATLFTDSLIDEKELSKFSLITICQEESIKILTSVYGIENNFWKFWNARRNEYLEAIFLEKELVKKQIVTLDQYEVLADKKSSFGKVAIDCLFSLDAKDNTLHEQLLLSHAYFSTAFQLNDDIQDFKEDLNKGQFNWAIYLLNEQNIPINDPEILEKYLYIRGISKKMYQLGIEYCEKALKTVQKIHVPKWKKILLDTKRTFETAIIEIDTYLEILTSEINLSTKKVANISIQ